MKKPKKTRSLKPLHLLTETIKVLTDTKLQDVHGGHTSFSCGHELCTTHMN